MSQTTGPNYQARAEEAFRYATEECRRKAKENAGYEALHDEHLAKFYVLNHLHDRTFTHNPKELAKALKSLRANAPSPPEVFSQERFLCYYNREVDAVLNTIAS